MPEEINRIVADHISDYLFAPTKSAIKNLKSENQYKKAFLTGDIMVDTLNHAITKCNDCKILTSIGCEDYRNDYYLLTLHRPYNVDNPKNLNKILYEIGKLKKQVIFPVHPRTRKSIEANNLKVADNTLITKPVGYMDFICLQINSSKIITDSGGIQKEAYLLKKPCITLRSETEWVETVELGWNLLIDPNLKTNYYKEIQSFDPTNKHLPLFGKNVSWKMCNIIKKLKIG